MSQRRAHGRLGAGERLCLLHVRDGILPGRTSRNDIPSLVKRGMVRITDTQVVKHPTRAYAADNYALTARGKYVAEQILRRFHDLRPRGTERPGRYLGDAPVGEDAAREVWLRAPRWVQIYAATIGYGPAWLVMDRSLPDHP